jgi:hypothetical protein
MLIWWVDPAIWGFQLLAIVPYGEVKMTSCNSWEATFGTDVFGYNFGQDPFKDGVLINSLEPYGASYSRLPSYP